MWTRSAFMQAKMQTTIMKTGQKMATYRTWFGLIYTCSLQAPGSMWPQFGRKQQRWSINMAMTRRKTCYTRLGPHRPCTRDIDRYRRFWSQYMSPLPGMIGSAKTGSCRGGVYDGHTKKRKVMLLASFHSTKTSSLAEGRKRHGNKSYQ